LNGPGYTGKSNAQDEGIKSFPHQMFVTKPSQKGRPDLTHTDTEAKDFMQEAGVPLSSETHSGTDVPVYAKGPASHLLTGVYEQNYIYHVMQHAFRFE